MIELKAEVDRFCKWADSTSHNSAEWETEYPHWPSLLDASEDALGSPRLSPGDIRLLLFVIARDNECERVKDMLPRYPKNGMELAFSARGYPDFEARWQLADFLGTQGGAKTEKFLWAFFRDENEYVRRRSMLAMVGVDRKSAETMAVSLIQAAEEYSRLAAIRVLSELESKSLMKALAQLKLDSSQLVRKTVSEIMEAV